MSDCGEQRSICALEQRTPHNDLPQSATRANKDWIGISVAMAKKCKGQSTQLRGVVLLSRLIVGHNLSATADKVSKYVRLG